MKKFLLMAVALLGFAASAQVDKIYKHNGEVVDGKVVKLEEFTVIFSIFTIIFENNCKLF